MKGFNAGSRARSTKHVIQRSGEDCLAKHTTNVVANQETWAKGVHCLGNNKGYFALGLLLVVKEKAKKIMYNSPLYIIFVNHNTK